MSPLQNRVDPFGAIHAVAARGGFMGNRGGCFHDDEQRLTRRRWSSRRWITCVLAFKGRRRALMQPGLYTELFFLDEATALAAGHRPCFECRRADADAFRAAFAAGAGLEARPGADEMDARVHEARIAAIAGGPRPKARVADLPPGAMVADEDRAFLVTADGVRPWTFLGYGGHAPAPARPLAVLTPAPFLGALRAGYRPKLHDSASG